MGDDLLACCGGSYPRRVGVGARRTVPRPCGRAREYDAASSGRRPKLLLLPLCWLLATTWCCCSSLSTFIFKPSVLGGRMGPIAAATSSSHWGAYWPGKVSGGSCTSTSNPLLLHAACHRSGGYKAMKRRDTQGWLYRRVDRRGLLLAMASNSGNSDGGMPALPVVPPPPAGQPLRDAEVKAPVGRPIPGTAVVSKSDAEEEEEEEEEDRSLEPYNRRARFELHRTWQSVTSVDVVEDGQIVGTRGGLPCKTFLRWLDKPKNVLLLMKRGSPEILQRGAELAAFLQSKGGIRVLVERQVKQDLHTNYGMEVSELYGPRNRTSHEVDAVITLGGDGLLMHANWLFQRAAPIILPVNLGSLGFLLPFEYEDIYNSVDRLLTEDVQLTLRMRLSCRIIRNGTVVMNLAVMNDVVVERGSSPYLASLDCFCNGQFITTVQADGIIIATPTGSTAYSMSAGGSMVHPGIQALLMTPICPHSLSFRPLLFPDTSVLSLRMPCDARTYAWISFDGRFRHRLMVGDILEVSKSEYPLPTVTHQNVTADWFASLSKAFNFNQRTRQKPLNMSPAPEGCEDPVFIEPLSSCSTITGSSGEP